MSIDIETLETLTRGGATDLPWKVGQDPDHIGLYAVYSGPEEDKTYRCFGCMKQEAEFIAAAANAMAALLARVRELELAAPDLEERRKAASARIVNWLTSEGRKLQANQRVDFTDAQALLNAARVDAKVDVLFYMVVKAERGDWAWDCYAPNAKQGSEKP